jgi:hypothetical protein
MKVSTDRSYWARIRALEFVEAMELLDENERDIVMKIRHPTKSQIWQQKWIKENPSNFP